MHPNDSVSPIGVGQGVPEPDETSFGDGLTRRSLKRSQAAQPPLERRGALSDLAS